MSVQLLLCAALMLGTVMATRGGLVAQGRYPTFVGFDVQSASLGLLAILSAAWFFGPIYGFTLIVAVALHEFGHVAAYRIAGHHDARFRLVPLLGGVAISDQHPATQEKAFFIALMGPAICIAPTAIAQFAGTELLEEAPMLAEMLLAFSLTAAMLNFFNLLPLWPLDGGRCTALLLSSLWPQSVRPALLIMSAGLALTGFTIRSVLLVIFALFSAQTLARSHQLLQVQRPMSSSRAILAAAAYAATLGTFWLAGGRHMILLF